MKTREAAAEEYGRNKYGEFFEDSVKNVVIKDFLAGCEFESQNTAEIAKAFARWKEHSSWELDYREQRSHTTDEKFEYFIAVIWPSYPSSR